MLFEFDDEAVSRGTFSNVVEPRPPISLEDIRATINRLNAQELRLEPEPFVVPQRIYSALDIRPGVKFLLSAALDDL